MKQILIILLSIFFGFPLQAIIPNPDFHSDRLINYGRNSALLSGTAELNINIKNRFALGGYVSHPGGGMLGSKQNINVTYFKLLLYENAEKIFSIGFYVSSFRVDGQEAFGGLGSTLVNEYSFNGINFGPLVSYRFYNFVLRAAVMSHSIYSQSATRSYPEIPLDAADPNGIEIAWLITPNFEIDAGLSRFGLVGIKIKL